MVRQAKFKNSTLITNMVAFAVATSINAASAAPPEQANDGGQALFDDKGGLFMEEVDAPKPKPKPKLIPIDLSRVGVSVSPNGNIIPTKEDPTAPWAGTGVRPFINQTTQTTELIPQSYFYNQGPYPGTGYFTPGYYPGLSGGVNRGYTPGYNPYFNAGYGGGYGAGYGGYNPGFYLNFNRGLNGGYPGYNPQVYGGVPGFGFGGYPGYGGGYPGFNGYGGYPGYSGFGGYPGYNGLPPFNNYVPPGAVNLRLGNLQVGLATNPLFYPRTTTQSSMWRSFNLGF